jgi:hypothetical protein
MKKLGVIIAFCFVIINCDAQRKILFRPSLGFATQESRDGIFTKSITGNEVSINFNNNTNLLDKWFPPQFGFMVDYQHNKHHTFSVGIMEAAVRGDFNITTKSATDSFSLPRFGASNYISIFKFGVEYAYTFGIPNKNKDYNELTKRFNFTFLIGIFNAKLNNNSFGGISYSVSTKSVDSNIISYDSTLFWQDLLHNNTIMISPGLRIGFKNLKGIEKISLTIMYDKGLRDIIAFRQKGYSNKIQNSFTSAQYSAGNQWKFYFSLPLTLYDFNKKKHRIGYFFE